MVPWAANNLFFVLFKHALSHIGRARSIRSIFPLTLYPIQHLKHTCVHDAKWPLPMYQTGTSTLTHANPHRPKSHPSPPLRPWIRLELFREISSDRLHWKYSEGRVCKMNMTSPMVLCLDDDSKNTVLGTPDMADQLPSRRIVEVTEIHRLGLGAGDPIQVSLSQGLLYTNTESWSWMTFICTKRLTTKHATGISSLQPRRSLTNWQER